MALQVRNQCIQLQFDVTIRYSTPILQQKMLSTYYWMFGQSCVEIENGKFRYSLEAVSPSKAGSNLEFFTASVETKSHTPGRETDWAEAQLLFVNMMFEKSTDWKLVEEMFGVVFFDKATFKRKQAICAFPTGTHVVVACPYGRIRGTVSSTPEWNKMLDGALPPATFSIKPDDWDAFGHHIFCVAEELTKIVDLE